MALTLAYEGVPTPDWMRGRCTCYTAGEEFGPEPAGAWECPQHGAEAGAWMQGVRDAQEELARLLVSSALSDPTGTVFP